MWLYYFLLATNDLNYQKYTNKVSTNTCFHGCHKTASLLQCILGTLHLLSILYVLSKPFPTQKLSSTIPSLQMHARSFTPVLLQGIL